MILLASHYLMVKAIRWVYFEVAKITGKSQRAQAQMAQVHDVIKEPLE